MNTSTDSSKYVEINDLIIKYVKKFPFSDDAKKEIDLDHIRCEDIDYQCFIIDQEMDNEIIAHDGGPIPISNSVFSCVFKNQTSENQQENTLEMSRETRLKTIITMSKSILKDNSLNFQLQAPNSVIGANTAFKKSVTINKNREYSLEESLTWKANSKVIVRSGKQVKAELTVDEDEMKFDFKIKTKLSGTLKIHLNNKKTGLRLKDPLEVKDLTKIFTSEDEFEKNPDNTVSFTSNGTCYLKYGTLQLNLIESIITND